MNQRARFSKNTPLDGDSLLRVSAVYLLLLAVALAPIFAVNVPPLTDYPNNLARTYIFLNLGTSQLLQSYYVSMLSTQPNLAMDLVVPLLGRIIPIEWAGKVFLALTFIGLSAGTLVLHHAIFRRWSLWPCAAFLFLYNRLFVWGFIGFLFTLGLSLFAFATWIYVRERHYAVRFMVNTLWAFVIYFGHLFALGVLGLVVGGYELHRQYLRYQREKRFSVGEIVASCLPLLVPLVVFVLLSPTVGHAGATLWGSWRQRLTAPFYLVNNYFRVFDAITLIVLVGLWAWLAWRRKLLLSGVIGVGLLLLSIAQLAMPDLLFSSYFADRRLPVVIAFLAIAGSSWSASSRVLRDRVLVLLCGLFLVRMVVIAVHWSEVQRLYNDYLAAIDKLPRGARLMDIGVQHDIRSMLSVPVAHIASLAIIKKDVFLPSLFSYPLNGAGSIAFKKPYAELVRLTPFSIVFGETADVAKKKAEKGGVFDPNLQECYEYLLISSPSEYVMSVPDDYKSFYKGGVVGGRSFEIYETKSAGQSFERCTLVQRPDVHTLPSRNGYLNYD